MCVCGCVCVCVCVWVGACAGIDKLPGKGYIRTFTKCYTFY